MIENLSELLEVPLKVKKISLYGVPLHMKREFEISTGKISSRTTLVIRLEVDDLSGYGEIPVLPHPIYSGEFFESAVGFVKIIKELVENRTLTLLELHSLLNGFRGNNFAKSGIEFAFWHIVFQHTGMSIFDFLKPSKNKFRLQLSIGIGTFDEIGERVEWAFSQGIRAIKLKIKPGWSKKPVEFVKNTYNPEFISVDANGSFNPFQEEHIKELFEITDMVDEIEQPFRPPLIHKHAEFANRIKASVSLDESIEKLEDFLEAAELFPVVVNIKPPRVGGLLNSLRLAGEINKRKLQAFIGGMLETTWGRVQNMIVASMPSVCEKFPGDFSPAEEFYSEDLAEPGFKIKNGYIEVKDPGEVKFKEEVLKETYRIL